MPRSSKEHHHRELYWKPPSRAGEAVERFGPHPDPERVYDEITGEMQDKLSELQDNRTLPVVG